MTDDDPTAVHKARSKKDKKAVTYCFRSADDMHDPRVIRREFEQVTSEHLKFWPALPKGVHVREYVECSACGKYAQSERATIPEAEIMLYVTHYDRPLLKNRLVS